MKLKTLAEKLDKSPNKRHFDDRGLPVGWCHGSVVNGLAKRLDGKTTSIINGGTYFGRSAYLMALMSPNAVIYCLDTYKGSAEHKDIPEVKDMFDIMASNLWEFNTRIVPVIADSVDGMKAIHAECPNPDLVFIDMSHDANSVCRDVMTAKKLFTKSLICGDDYTWQSVRDGLFRACFKHEASGAYWELIK